MAFFKIIKDSFIDFYEHLFKLVLLSLGWFTLTVFPIMSVFSVNIVWLKMVLAVFSLVISGPIILSGLEFINRLFTRDDPGIKDFFTGIRNYLKRGIIAFLLTGVIYLILFFDIRYFSTSSDNWLMLVITIFMIYITTFFSMMMIHFWGLLVKMKKEKIWYVLKYSFFLTMENVLVTALLLLFIVIFTVLMTIFLIAAPAIYFALVALVITNGTGYALKKMNGE